MIADSLSQRVARFSHRLEELKAKYGNSPENASEILSDALEELQVCLDALSSIEKSQRDKGHIHILPLSAFENTFISEDGVIVESNEQFARTHGYELAEVIGQPVTNFMVPQEHERVKDALQSGKELTDEYLALNKDGSTFPIEAHDYLIEGKGKTVRVTIVKDITEHKRIEEELKKSEEKSRLLIKYAPSMIYEIDFRVPKFTSVNDVMCSVLGYSQEELLAMNPLDLLVGDSKTIFQDRIGKYLAGEKLSDSIEYAGRAKDGHIVYGLLNISFTCEDSNPVGAVVVAHDITERKKIEESMRESEIKYQYLLEHAPASIYELDFSGTKFKLVNDTMCRTLGYTREELMAMNPIDLLDEESQVQFQERVRKVLAGAPIDESITYRVFGKKGQEIRVVINVKLVYADGAMDGALVVAHDVTEQKRMEEALQKAKDELELRVAERTAGIQHVNEKLETINAKLIDEIKCHVKDETELQIAKEEQAAINTELQAEIEEHKKTEYELREAKEAAEAAVEAKAAFLANMSHELRTPLNAVIGFSTLLLEDNLTEEQKEYIERIRYGGESLLAVISDILEFSRAEKKKVKLEHQPFSLKHSIEESLGMVSVKANDKGLNLAYTMSYGTPDTIIGDQGRLRQVLVNLLSNAVKFTDEGDISVSVSSQVLDGNKRQFQFAVGDTGIGIPQDKMDRLFQPFTQLEYTLSRKRDGAGLGLAICKELVELMGGKIWAESEMGKGSTFRFTIHAETLPGKQLDLGKKDKAIEYENLSAQKPLAILVAEDNPSNQRVLVEMLKRLGYRADAVADGCEVLQALQIRPYDLIFMDIRMPEMDGLTATREIRKLWPENGPKVVAITAFAMAGDKEKCLEAGADEYISKPVKVDDLATLLRNIALPQE